MSAYQRLICIDCGGVMTDEEHHYYEYRCEACERQWAADLGDWMKGGENEAFDKLYSVPEPIRH